MHDADKIPNVNLTLYDGVSVTKDGMDFFVLEGQVFGIECRTQEQFQVNGWYGTSLFQGLYYDIVFL